jgi:hypothetical protein
VGSDAFLVPYRILRRVVKRDRRLTWLGGARPGCYVITGIALAAIVDGQEVGLPAGEPWPETVILVAQPEPEELAYAADLDIVRGVWRRLLRARIESEVDLAFRSGRIDGAGLAKRISEIGRTEFEEARMVLRKDGLLLPPDTDLATYRAFAAVFLEFILFEPAALPVLFPAIEEPDRVRAILEQDVDARGLLDRTRLAGAPTSPIAPERNTSVPDPITESSLVALSPALPGDPSARVRRLTAEARKATERGNSVRAAILWKRLAQQKPMGEDRVPRAAARSALKDLAVRLRKALFVQKGESSLWADALSPLLDRATSEFWSPERRLLHDLQNVCLDHEREVFRLEPLGWILSWGRRPLRHPLPHLREVTMSRHLRSASRRLRRVRLPSDAQVRLEGLLRTAVENSEKELRDRFRPWVDATIESTWVPPVNLPERVAYRKLIEELLDPIQSRGFSTLGDLRDAASRSNLKLHDLSGPAEFFRGDRLLQADKELGTVLDGVHRRGEVYLRWLQRLSAAAFGTRVGRFVTLHFALPFGGAFVLLKGLEEINDVFVARFTGFHVHLTSMASVLLLGALALGIINYVRFRQPFLAALRAIGRILRAVLLDLPLRVFHHPLVQKLIASWPAIAAWRLAIKPGFLAVVFWAIGRWVRISPGPGTILGVGAFLAASLLFNTRTGQMIEEVTIEQVSQAWRSLIFEVLPGLFHIVMAAFDRAREWVEKLIYAGDEWLRFREGQSRGLLALKAVLGLGWGVVTYAARIYLNLLVEPQLNPIKHFPVVTVAAKIMLPVALTITRLIALTLTPFVGSLIAGAIAAVTVFFLPGVFGFLVWEFRSNWLLYEANRAKALGPVVVGSHGETVVRLLRPGFHSGTLPKLFRRLRRALAPGLEGKAIRNREALHHVEESVRKLVDRDLAALLHESPALEHRLAEPGEIHLAANRIRFELTGGDDVRAGLWIDLVEQSGLLTSAVVRPGWLASLSALERRTLGVAMAGFYKICGVDLVDHLEKGDAGSSAVSAAASEVLCPLQSVAFADVEIPWREWILAWEAGAERAGEAHTPDWAIRFRP